MSKHRLRPRSDGTVTGALLTIGVALPWLLMIWKDANPLYFLVLFLVWAVVIVGLTLQTPQSYGRRKRDASGGVTRSRWF